MTISGVSVLGREHQLSADDETAFGRAVAAILTERYPAFTVAKVAQDMRCTKKAAENLLAAHLSARTITRLARTYGLGLLIDAGARVTGQTLEDFITQQAAEADLAEARARERARAIHVLRANLQVVRGGAPGSGRRRP